MSVCLPHLIILKFLSMFYLSYPVKVFATSGSEDLAQQICSELEKRLPPPIIQNSPNLFSKINVVRFSNDNLQVQVDNVRGHFVVIVHTQVAPVNDHLMELFALLDAVINSKPADVLLVFPYMPYSRSDRKNQPRISTMSHRIAQIISKSFGIKKVLLLDPHDSHIKHYFEPAADEITSVYLFSNYIQKYIINKNLFQNNNKNDTVIVFADTGAAKRFSNIAYHLQLPVAYIDKERPDNTEVGRFKKVVGEVQDKKCILIDDEILTGGTVIGDANILMENGAKEIYMAAIHPILSSLKESEQNLINKLESSFIGQFIVSNSVPVEHKIKNCRKFTVLSVAPLLAEAINRLVQNESITYLHDPANLNLYE